MSSMNMPSHGFFQRTLERTRQAAELKKQKEMQTRLDAQATMQSQAGPNTLVPLQSEMEKRAGVNPANFTGLTDIKTGELIDRYKYDPYSGQAAQALKEQAFSQGTSPWAQMQLQAQQLEQQKAQDLSSRQQQQAQGEAQSMLARGGGLSGGARAMLARQGARDQLMANQGVSRAGMEQRMGIGQADQERKQNLLQGFQDLESKGSQFNIGNLSQDLTARAAFDANRYNQQMSAYGAKQSAEAQRAAARGGKK